MHKVTLDLQNKCDLIMFIGFWVIILAMILIFALMMISCLKEVRAAHRSLKRLVENQEFIHKARHTRSLIHEKREEMKQKERTLINNLYLLKLDITNSIQMTELDNLFLTSINEQIKAFEEGNGLDGKDLLSALKEYASCLEIEERKYKPPINLKFDIEEGFAVDYEYCKKQYNLEKVNQFIEDLTNLNDIKDILEEEYEEKVEETNQISFK